MLIPLLTFFLVATQLAFRRVEPGTRRTGQPRVPLLRKIAYPALVGLLDLISDCEGNLFCFVFSYIFHNLRTRSYFFILQHRCRRLPCQPRLFTGPRVLDALGDVAKRFVRLFCFREACLPRRGTHETCSAGKTSERTPASNTPAATATTLQPTLELRGTFLNHQHRWQSVRRAKR